MTVLASPLPLPTAASSGCGDFNLTLNLRRFDWFWGQRGIHGMTLKGPAEYHGKPVSKDNPAPGSIQNIMIRTSSFMPKDAPTSMAIPTVGLTPHHGEHQVLHQHGSQRALRLTTNAMQFSLGKESEAQRYRDPLGRARGGQVGKAPSQLRTPRVWKSMGFAGGRRGWAATYRPSF